MFSEGKLIFSNFKKLTVFWKIIIFCLFLIFSGIEPQWETEENIDGGRFVVEITKKDRNTFLNSTWLETLLILINEEFADHSNINGCVVQNRKKADKVTKKALVFEIKLKIVDQYMDARRKKRRKRANRRRFCGSFGLALPNSIPEPPRQRAQKLDDEEVVDLAAQVDENRELQPARRSGDRATGRNLFILSCLSTTL